MTYCGTKRIPLGTTNHNSGVFGVDQNGEKVEIHYQHAYIATKADDKYVYVINPWEAQKEIKLSISDFVKVFYHAELATLKE